MGKQFAHCSAPSRYSVMFTAAITRRELTINTAVTEATIVGWRRKRLAGYEAELK